MKMYYIVFNNSITPTANEQEQSNILAYTIHVRGEIHPNFKLWH
jgi:hypothetical protein